VYLLLANRLMPSGLSPRLTCNESLCSWYGRK